MSIESHILTLAEAIKENTQALRDVLAASASTTPAPVKEKKAKAAKAAEEPKVEETAIAIETPEPVVEETHAVIETPEPAIEQPETTDEPTVTFVDKDDFIAKVTAHVQGVFAAAGNAIGDKKIAYSAIRDAYGIKTAKELDEDKWAAFWNDVTNL
jgi:hypothetical protein